MKTPRILPILTTRVGHATWGDNYFRGHGVSEEIAGKTGLWRIISLSIGGPVLSEVDIGVLDDITSCSLAADPRIWPMKLTRVATAHGRAVFGMCVGMLGIDRAPMGGDAVGAMAKTLVMLVERIGRGHQLLHEIERVLATRGRFPGFGVPFREQDERVTALRRCLSNRGRDNGRHWQLVHEIEEQLSKKQRIPMNLAAAMAGVLLDLGFTAEQVPAMASIILLPNFLANAYEGAQQRPAVLQRLPDAVIHYVGPPPRESPRATAARKARDSEPGPET